MSRYWIRRSSIVVSVLFVLLVNPAEGGEDADPPASALFGHSLIRTAGGKLAKIEAFLPNRVCGICHPRHVKELQGSMHSMAHRDPLYRAFAELARKEAGPSVYTYCSGCHSPAGVVSGLIPAKLEPDLPDGAKAGVTCDVCHQISALTGHKGPWGEPGNASFVLQPSLTKFGPSGEVTENLLHTGEKRDFFSKSEFCASCHTVIHPRNGLRIEHTYGEWKSSIYAKKGIHCQDCHMRSIEDSLKVARTLQPVVVEGRSAELGPIRKTYSHFFVGGNANADVLGNGKLHAQMAESRLKSAARLELKVPDKAAAGEELSLDVLVHNVAAGHNLPTGVTELRQMWVDLRILDGNGKTVFRTSGLDEHGEFRSGGIWFGTIAGDEFGKKTYRPWKMTQFIAKRAIAPRSFTRDKVSAKLPNGISGPVTVEATLFYRSAPLRLISVVMKEGEFAPKTVEMSSAREELVIE